VAIESQEHVSGNKGNEHKARKTTGNMLNCQETNKNNI
jgi:hypothetical protein